MNGATPISSSIWPSTWLPSTTDNIQGAGGLYRPLTSSCKKGTIIRIVPFLFPGYARQHSGLISFPLAEELCRKEALFRSEEHTSELQSLMRISYAVFCLKKKNIQ